MKTPAKKENKVNKAKNAALLINAHAHAHAHVCILLHRFLLSDT
jgi:hypothetical protein